MIIGIPKEIKSDEYRVALIPVGVEEMIKHGHTVLVEKGAGMGSGISDLEYKRTGARIVDNPKEIYDQAQFIMKVKEPLPIEYPLLREDQIIFTFFHFAASKTLTDAVLKAKVVAIAYETIRDEHGQHPILTPMSEVAGRMSIQEGAKYLEKPMLGRGILLGSTRGSPGRSGHRRWRCRRRQCRQSGRWAWGKGYGSRCQYGTTPVSG